LSNATIVGIGTASPAYSISQANSVSVARRFVHDAGEATNVLPALYRMTRVARRASVVLDGPSEEELEIQQSFYLQANSADDRGPTTQQRMERFAAAAGELAVSSAAAALQDAAVPAAQVTHLVTVTCTGFYAPGFDIELISGLGLSGDVQRIQVGFMGCHAIINAMRAATAIAIADPQACVLVVAVELCSLHYQYGWDPDRVVANALFADGSGALVIRNQSATEQAPQIRATGSRWLPGTQDAMSWKIGDHGYQMTLAATVPSCIEAHLPGYLEQWLGDQGLTIQDIRGWATHPGGPRVLTSVEQSLNLPADSLAISRGVLSEHGNMSSATLVFILKQMRQANIPLPWLMLGFGPGLEIEVALLTTD